MPDKNSIDKFGALFRLVTPLLIAIVGFFSIKYLDSIDKNFDSIKTKFDTFLESYHVMDKRVDRLEYKVFGNQGNRYDGIEK